MEREITSKTADKFFGCGQLLRNQEEVSKSKTFETDCLRVRASKINARPQGTESVKCTEKEDNSSQEKSSFKNFRSSLERKLLQRNLNYQSYCGS